MWGCQEGDKKPGGCLGPLLPLSVGTDTLRPPKAATVRAHIERSLASSGEPLYRRMVNRQQTVYYISI